IAVGLWKYTGFGIILFLAGLKAIPVELYEAAKVDGVNGWQNLIYITLPNLKGSFSLVGIWGTVDQERQLLCSTYMLGKMPLPSSIWVRARPLLSSPLS